MKKWIPAVCIILLIWNILLTVILFSDSSHTSQGNTVSENTVNGYTTDVTEVADTIRSSIVTVHTDTDDASGVIYAADDSGAYIMTVFTAVERTSSISVIFDSGSTVDAQLVGSDEETGLALLKVEPSFEVTAISRGDSDVISQGEYVVAMGGRRTSTNQAEISFGVVTTAGTRKTHSSSQWYASILSADTAVNDENIGGALVNISGELLGILIPDIEESVSGIGYAVSVNEVQNFYSELKKEGAVTRGNAEIIVRSVSKMKSYEKSQRNIALNQNAGVLVTEIPNESPCIDILQIGDVITSIDGNKIQDLSDWYTKLYSKNSGDTVTLVLLRDGKEASQSVVLK